MPDSKITALTSILTSTDPANDPLVIVDVSDTSMAATGTTKKVTLNQLLGASGTATLASATITGDLTVDTSTLIVNSSQNRVGIGFSGSASSGRLQISQPLSSTIDGALRITDDATTSFVFNNVSSGVSGIWSSGAIAFGVGSGTFAEAMRLNSTGLGVGTSPSYKLDVSSTSNIVGRVSSSSVLNTGFNIVNTTGSTWSLYSFGSNDATLQNSFGIYHQNGTSFLQITQAGNVGIGVTPSAWGVYKGLQVGLASLAGYGTQADTMLGANVFFDGTNYKYIGSYAASQYRQQAGVHSWHNVGAGTAGNTLTFTQAMTLDASGNLLVGTVTSPTGTKVGSIAKLSQVSVEGTNYINVSTTPVALARPIGTGALFFVSGYNTAGGAQGWWLVASTGAAVPTVIASGNNTLLTVAFTQVSGVLNMNTTSGTVAVTAFSITN